MRRILDQLTLSNRVDLHGLVATFVIRQPTVLGPKCPPPAFSIFHRISSTMRSMFLSRRTDSSPSAALHEDSSTIQDRFISDALPFTTRTRQ